MNAQEIAAKAAELVSGDRERTHGDKAVNFANIARLWNAWLRNNCADVTADLLNAADVASLMALLKIARMSSGEFNWDDYVDGSAYVAIAGELAASGETRR